MNKVRKAKFAGMLAWALIACLTMTSVTPTFTAFAAEESVTESVDNGSKDTGATTGTESGESSGTSNAQDGTDKSDSGSTTDDGSPKAGAEDTGTGDSSGEDSSDGGDSSGKDENTGEGSGESEDADADSDADSKNADDEDADSGDEDDDADVDDADSDNEDADADDDADSDSADEDADAEDDADDDAEGNVEEANGESGSSSGSTGVDEAEEEEEDEEEEDAEDGELEDEFEIELLHATLSDAVCYVESMKNDDDEEENGYFTSVQDAIYAIATSSDAIVLIKDVNESIVIASGQTITLDLAGYTLSDDGKEVGAGDGMSSYAGTIENNGTLTITGNGTVDCTKPNGVALINYIGGICTIESGTFERSEENGAYEWGDDWPDDANSGYTIVNNGTMTINDGTFLNKGTASSLLENGFQRDSQDIDGSTAILIINGGEFYGGDCTIKNGDDAELIINDGIFENYNEDGNCVLAYEHCEIYGGTFNGTGDTIMFAPSYSDDDGEYTLIIKDGTFTSTSGYILNVFNGVYGLGGKSGIEISISGGEFYGSDKDIIYMPMTSSSATYTQCITGGYFDQDVASFVADGYEQYDDGWVGVADAVCRIDNNYYASVSDAVKDLKESGETEATIILLKDAQGPLHVPEGYDITLDLSGYKLTDSGNEATNEGAHDNEERSVTMHNLWGVIINEGTLTIIDTSDERTGTIDAYTTNYTAIVNEPGAICTIESGTITRSNDETQSMYTIINHGELIIEGGTIENPGTGSAVIENGFQTSSNYRTDWSGGDVETYMSANPATLTINDGSTITGGKTNVKDDVYAELYVNGGTFENNYNGCIYVHNDTVITGGTFTGSGSQVIYVNHDEGTSEEREDEKLVIEGGIFIAANDATMINTDEGANVIIYCGQFSVESNANEYLASSSDATKTVIELNDDGYYEVYTGEEVIVEAKCTTGGYTSITCNYCDDELTYDYTDALGHDFVSVVTDPTCTDEGYTTHTCARCGYSYKDDYTAALGHDWGDWVVTKEPTLTEDGEQIRTCKRCGAVETESIDKTGATVTIEITDSNGNPASGVVFSIYDEDGNEVGSYTQSAEVILEKGATYTIRITTSNGYTFDSTEITFTVTEGETETVKATNTKSTTGGHRSSGGGGGGGGGSSTSSGAVYTGANGLTGTWIFNGELFTFPDGTHPSNQYLIIDGEVYAFWTNGYAISFDHTEYYTPEAIAAQGDIPTATGTWDLCGWWFQYSDGSYPHNGWAQLSYNGRSDWYYFDVDGWMETGWLNVDGNTYYLHPLYDGTRGHMYTGWNEIDGYWYYFGTDGALYRNTQTPDGYTVDANGRRVE